MVYKNPLPVWAGYAGKPYYEASAEAWIKIASINVMVHRLQPG
jgi:hypothetical protein